MPSFMESSRNYFFILRKYGLKLSWEEIKGSLITIAILAFMFSFRDWGVDSFNAVVGLTNLLIAFFLMAIAFVISQLGQRLVSVYYGYNPEYKFSMIGLMIGVVISFASKGYIVFLTPGVIVLHHLAASRLGEFRYYTNMWEWAKVSFAGPLANFVFAMIISMFPRTPFVEKMLLINIMFAAFSCMPLPQMFPGGNMFYTMKYFWAFGTIFILTGCAVLWFFTWWAALLVALLCGVLVMTKFFFDDFNM